jgi:Arc/MetJ-type ribon-helix-helix transcriptional regulator/DNA-directed RNA polymerase subunit RPC12/RpoP
MPPMAPMFMGSMRRVRQTLSSRSNVVASRIGDEELRAIDMLIEAGLFNTRSEAVAYLVGEGIKARKDTFDKVSTTLQEIRKIKGEADEYLARLRKDVGLVTTEAYGKSETQPVLWKPQPESQPVRQVKKCPECGRDLANLPADIKACPYCSFKLEKE